MNIAARYLSLIVILSWTATSVAVEYSFSRIPGNPHAGVAINDDGFVAFVDDTSLLVTNGQTTTTIAGPSVANRLWDELSSQALSLNNNGYVAFRGRTADGTYGVLASDGATTRLIAPASLDEFGSSNIWKCAMSINDQGTVAYTAVPDSMSLPCVYAGDGISAPVLIGQSERSVAAIDNAGDFACIRVRRFPPSVISASIELTRNGQTYSLPGSIWNNAPDINELGAVAYRAAVDGSYRIVVADGVATPRYIDLSAYACPSSGLFFDGCESDCAINDQGLVVFGASPTDPPLEGIYTGPDPVTDKVIRAGDVLDGLTIQHLTFSRGGLNNNGQIAFTALLSDGTGAIYVATPVPEPTTLVLLTSAIIGLACLRMRQNRA